MAQETVFKLYDTFAEASAVVTALEAAGVPSDHISLISSPDETLAPDAAEIARNERITRDAGVGATAGGLLGGGAGLLAALGIMTIPGLGPVAAAGWLASTLGGLATGAAAGAAAGGVIGVLTEGGIDHELAEIYAESIRRGGALVSVRTDDKRASAVREVLMRHPAVDPVSRAQFFRMEGWRGGDTETTGNSLH